MHVGFGHSIWQLLPSLHLMQTRRNFSLACMNFWNTKSFSGLRCLASQKISIVLCTLLGMLGLGCYLAWVFLMLIEFPAYTPLIRPLVLNNHSLSVLFTTVKDSSSNFLIASKSQHCISATLLCLNHLQAVKFTWSSITQIGSNITIRKGVGRQKCAPSSPGWRKSAAWHFQAMVQRLQPQEMAVSRSLAQWQVNVWLLCPTQPTVCLLNSHKIIPFYLQHMRAMVFIFGMCKWGGWVATVLAMTLVFGIFPLLWMTITLPQLTKLAMSKSGMLLMAVSNIDSVYPKARHIYFANGAQTPQ